MNTFNVVVQIQNKNGSPLGSGIIISPNQILTVRHVIRNGQSSRSPLLNKNEILVAKENRILATMQIHTISRVESKSDEHIHDLALLTLESSFPDSYVATFLTDGKWFLSRWQNSHIMPICYGLPDSEFTPHEYETNEVIGGSTRNNQFIDLQFKGGFPDGSSGGPIVVNIKAVNYVIGIARLGGNNASSSRALSAETCLEFVSKYSDLKCKIESAKAILSIVGWKPVQSQISTLDSRNISDLLTWTTCFSDFIGRPLDQLTAWCQQVMSGDKVCCRVIHGEGGIGKTRYAFELADYLSKNNWQIFILEKEDEYNRYELDSFLKKSQSDHRLVIIDYGEQIRSDLGKLVSQLSKDKKPTAVIILSRHGQEYWGDDNDMVNLPNSRISELTFERLNELDAEMGFSLFDNVSKKLEIPENQRISQDNYTQWIQPSDNCDQQKFLRYPLYIIGAALCLKLNHNKSYQDLDSQQIINILVLHERGRVKKLEHSINLPAPQVGVTNNLQLLAIISGVIDKNLIGKLAQKTNFKLGLAKFEDLEHQLEENGLNILKKHNNLVKKIYPIQPDLLAAGYAFYQWQYIYQKDRKRVSYWLEFIIDELDSIDLFLSNISRWLHDCWRLEYNNDFLNIIEASLISLFENNQHRCIKAEKFFLSNRPLFTQLEKVIWKTLIEHSQHNDERWTDYVKYLNYLSYTFHRIRDSENTNQIINDIVSICREKLQEKSLEELKKNEDSIRILLIFSSNLNKLDEKVEALKIAYSALELSKNLYTKKVLTDKGWLGPCFGQLASIFASIADYKQAIENYKQAAQIYAELKKEDLNYYWPRQANSLKMISRCYHDLENFPEALSFAQKALVEEEDLVNQNILPLGDRLVHSSSFLGEIYLSLGDLKEANLAFQKALRGYDFLVKQNFRQYAPQQAQCLGVIGGYLLTTGEYTQAATQYLQVIGIYEKLSKSEPFDPNSHIEIDLICNLSNLLSAYLCNQNHIGALSASQKLLNNYTSLSKKLKQDLVVEKIICLHNNALLSYVTGDRIAAESYIEKSNKLPKPGLKKIGESAPEIREVPAILSACALSFTNEFHNPKLAQTAGKNSLEVFSTWFQHNLFVGPELGESLKKLVVTFFRLEEPKLTSIAMEIFQKFTLKYPAAFLYDFVDSLAGTLQTEQKQLILIETEEWKSFLKQLINNSDSQYEIANLLVELTNRLLLSGRNSDALNMSILAKKYVESAESEKNSQPLLDFARLRRNLANYLRILKEFDQSISVIRPAIEILIPLSEDSILNYGFDLGCCYDIFGLTFGETEKQREAKKVFQKAISVWELCINNDFSFYGRYLANSYRNLAIVYADLKNHNTAFEAYKKSRDIYETLVDIDFLAHAPSFAQCLNQYAFDLSVFGEYLDAINITQIEITLLQRLINNNLSQYLPNLAYASTEIAVRFAKVGEPEAGIAYSLLAVDTYDKLSIQDPERYSHELARSLDNLSIDYSDLGKTNEAIDTSTRAVQTYELIIKQERFNFYPNLANSLNNLISHLSKGDQLEDTLSAFQRLIDIWEMLAIQDFSDYGKKLLGALSRFSTQLINCSKLDKALIVCERILFFYEFLMQDGFVPGFTDDICHLSDNLANNEKHIDSLIFLQRARVIFENVEQPSAEYQYENAFYLDQLSILLGNAGYIKGSINAGKLAVKVYEPLLNQDFLQFAPEYARILENHAVYLNIAEDDQQALAISKLSWSIKEGLADKDFDKFAKDLGFSLYNTSEFLTKLGHLEEGVKAARRSLEIREQLADDSIPSSILNLAASLDRLALILSDANKKDEALTLSKKAVALMQDLREKNFIAYGAGLALMLKNLACHLKGFGYLKDAYESICQSYQIMQFFIKENLEAHEEEYLRHLNVKVKLEQDLNYTKQAEHTEEEIKSLQKRRENAPTT